MDTELFLSDGFRAAFRGSVLFGEPMKNRTTMRVGGDAPVFLEPGDEESLAFAIEKIRSAGGKFFVLGGGSNTVFPDEIAFAVVSTRKLPGKIEFDGERKSISVPAGAVWGSVIEFCRRENLGGLEEFTALSGTAGGAAFMNASCFSRSVSDVLASAEFLNLENLKKSRYIMEGNDWGYKASPFQNPQKIVLSVEFSVSTEGFDEERSREILEKRRRMGHFRAPSAGSVFRNDPENGIVAGRIIDECGLKGATVGGAAVAPWHGNFIVNENQKASAEDVENLVKLIENRVQLEKGIDLKREIIFARDFVDTGR